MGVHISGEDNIGGLWGFFIWTVSIFLPEPPTSKIRSRVHEKQFVFKWYFYVWNVASKTLFGCLEKFYSWWIKFCTGHVLKFLILSKICDGLDIVVAFHVDLLAGCVRLTFEAGIPLTWASLHSEPGHQLANRNLSHPNLPLSSLIDQ